MRRIAYITDIHLEESFPLQQGVQATANWKRIIDDVKEREVNEVIFGGDIGELAAYPAFFKSLENFKLALTPGNHDRSAEVLKYYRPGNRKWEEVYSAYEDEHLKYIFLDTSKEAISDEQYNWLAGELVTDKKLLLFLHHPILQIDTPVDGMHPLFGRERIEKRLETIRNEVLIFCGHYHMADHQSKNNISQFVTPAASFQIVKEAKSLIIDNSTFGYRIISIDDTIVESEILLYKEGAFHSIRPLPINAI